jgi:hypothetical protein
LQYSIFITTSDPETPENNQTRFEYFQRTIESLEKTNVDLSTLHIFDDCSKYEPKIKYFDELFAPIVYTDNINEYYRFTPSLKKMACFDRVHKTNKNELENCKNLGSTLNTVFAIDYMYNLYDSEYIVFIQDDVVFSENWLEKGINIFKRIDNDINYKEGLFKTQSNCIGIKKIGFLCLYNRIGSSSEKYYPFPTGHPGGVAWIIKRQFWTDYKENFKRPVQEGHEGYPLNCLDDQMGDLFLNNKVKNHSVRNLVDYKLAVRAHYIGWDCAKVGKSLVQHIGDKSCLLGGRDMSEHRSKNFIGEV